MNHFTVRLLRSLCIFAMLFGAMLFAISLQGATAMGAIGLGAALAGWIGWRSLTKRYKTLIEERAKPSTTARWIGIILVALSGLLLAKMILIGLANIVSGTQMSGELATGLQMHGIGTTQLMLMLVVLVAGVALQQSNRSLPTPNP